MTKRNCLLDGRREMKRSKDKFREQFKECFYDFLYQLMKTGDITIGEMLYMNEYLKHMSKTEMRVFNAAIKKINKMNNKAKEMKKMKTNINTIKDYINGLSQRKMKRITLYILKMVMLMKVFIDQQISQTVLKSI